jgi:putative DNA primase/helicase
MSLDHVAAQLRTRAVAGARARAALALEAAPTDWPDPLPILPKLHPVDPLAPEMLPPALWPFVVDVAERMQVSADFVAAAGIVALAGCLNRRALVRPKAHDHTWREPLNLWGALVGPPGVLKSPTLQVVLEPLQAIENNMADEFLEQQRRHTARLQAHEVELRLWKQAAAAARKRGSPPGDPPVAPEPPIRRRLLVTDATREALQRILAENEHGVFVVWDELGGLLELFERDGRQGERQLFLTAWNGKGSFTVDRIGRGTLHARSVCLSLFGNLLPGRVERLVAAAHSGDLRSDGLLQRLQVLVWPDVRRDFQLVDRPADEEASFLMATLAHRFVELEGTELVFTDPAQLLFNDWLCELELKLRSGELSEPLAAHLGKYRSLMPKLAALYELIERAASGAEIAGEVKISLDNARRAAATTAYLESHARRVYACGGSQELEAARELAQRLKAGELGPQFTARDVYRRQWSGLDEPDRVEATLEVLEAHGWVRAAKIQRPDGGRPTTLWQLNPRISEAQA